MKWLKKWGYLSLFIIVGLFYFSYTDQWKAYAKALSPMAEWYEEQSEKHELLATVNDWFAGVLEQGVAIAGQISFPDFPDWLPEWMEPDESVAPGGNEDDEESFGSEIEEETVGENDIKGESDGETGEDDTFVGEAVVGGDDADGETAGDGNGTAGDDLGILSGENSGGSHIVIGGPENGVEVEFGDGENSETGEPDWRNVKDLYFADAVFIGDSRTVGLFEYGGLEEITTFYAGEGLSVYDVFDKKIVSVPGQKKKITVEEALQQKNFSKIYLMLGLNEMGTGTTETFLVKYKEVLDHLQELQPDAIVYVQAIMKLTTKRSGKGDQFHNPGIEERNLGISQFADNETVFYLDVNPLICDETGGMIEEYTYDGIHLKAKYIEIWKDYLKSHAIIP